MKEYKLLKQGEAYLCRDGEMILYRGSMRHAQGYAILTMYNAFADVVFSIRWPKNNGLRLRRNRKSEGFQCIYEGEGGEVRIGEEGYEWKQGECEYHIMCRKENDQVDMLLQDRYEYLGGVIMGRCMIKQSLYSAEICAMWMLLQERIMDKSMPLMDQEAFLQRWKEAALL